MEDASVVEQMSKVPRRISSTLGKIGQISSDDHPLRKSPSTWSLGWRREESIFHLQTLHLDFHAWQSLSTTSRVEMRRSGPQWNASAIHSELSRTLKCSYLTPPIQPNQKEQIITIQPILSDPLRCFLSWWIFSMVPGGKVCCGPWRGERSRRSGWTRWESCGRGRRSPSPPGTSPPASRMGSCKNTYFFQNATFMVNDKLGWFEPEKVTKRESAGVGVIIVIRRRRLSWGKCVDFFETKTWCGRKKTT